MSRETITLASEADWPGFRREARALLARDVAPDAVVWHTACSEAEDLFGADTVPDAVSAEPESSTPEFKQKEAETPTARAQTAIRTGVPAAFITLCETVVLHSDPGRFGLLYRLLWRLAHEPALRHDAIDADRVQAQQMAQSVRRDMHKMKAFVRFRVIERSIDGNGDSDGNSDGSAAPLHVAWFEPEHHIAEAVAPFFVRRFTQMEWAILTPECSLRWDGKQLAVGPGASRADAPPPDAGESLWLTYYASIFNPARLKVAMMKKEMPVKYWRNLPEAALIGELTAGATERSGRMVEAEATTPARRIASPTLPEEPAMTNADPAAHLPESPQAALAALKRATDRCRECPIGEHATQSVFGEGPAGAALMVVGEQPGDQEDLRGRPFVGPSGQLFDKAIAELGWPRERIYVTNAVKHFKFELRGKRRIHKTPGQREAAACLHWLEAEIAQVKPRALVALGATAARALLGRPVAVTRERGQWHTSPRGDQVLVTLHPSALLRGDPAQHAEAYAAWVADLALAAEYAMGGS